MNVFYDAHRADTDVSALLQLLSRRLPGGGPSVVEEVLSTAARPIWIVEAVDAPFSAEDALKIRGYRWDAARRFWWIETSEAAADEEVSGGEGGLRRPGLSEASPSGLDEHVFGDGPLKKGMASGSSGSGAAAGLIACMIHQERI